MPFLIPIAVTIGAAIVSAITIVAAAIGPILIAIGAAVAAIAAVVVSVTVVVVQSLIVAFTWFGSQVVANIGWVVDWITTHSRTVYNTVAAYVHSTAGTFRHLLDIIHFKTILQVHSIAQIVSPQYRAMMVKVYDAISRASDALGLGPMFLTLAIQNTRNLVLDVTSMFGQKYDLGQVSWLGTMNNYLDHFNTHVEKYRLNPEAVFWDLAELIERPAQDAKGAFQQGIISSLDTVLDFAAKVGDGLSQIGIDIETLYNDLPQFVKNTIPDPGTVFWDNFGGFLDDHYRPTIQALQDEIGGWSQDLQTSQQTVAGLVAQLRKPGDLIRNIDALPAYEREDQDRILAEFSNRRLGRLVDRLMPALSLSREKLDSNARIPIPPPLISPILSYEASSGSVPGVGGTAQRGSWFVGDY
ncbi:hypothetical protein LCGC14_1918990 [marine sediment metagenome]|uniref:Uncharacterized protein n=1 Tax=marine sediment metagenome TaxID=412755 RepID=A0A0F9GEP1_9ZZZZ